MDVIRAAIAMHRCHHRSDGCDKRRLANADPSRGRDRDEADKPWCDDDTHTANLRMKRIVVG